MGISTRTWIFLSSLLIPHFCCYNMTYNFGQSSWCLRAVSLPEWPHQAWGPNLGLTYHANTTVGRLLSYTRKSARNVEMQFNGFQELWDISQSQCFSFWAQENANSESYSTVSHWPLLFEVVIVACCFFPRFRWRRRLLVISAPNDEDWAYSQQLSALSGQACNFGEWEASSSLLSHTTLFLVSSKMKHRSSDYSNTPPSRLQIPRHLLSYIEYKVAFRLAP